MAKLVLKRQDPKSKKYFASERKYLLGKLSKNLIFSIIHFGSTAIPGLKGKGMIDIYLIAKSKNDALELLEQICKSTNYLRPGVGGSNERIFHRRQRKINGKRVMFHLHVSWRRAKDWKKVISFMNYLIEHPEAAKKYEDLKYLWAKMFNYDRKKYHDSKSGFVARILRKASD